MVDGLACATPRLRAFPPAVRIRPLSTMGGTSSAFGVTAQ
jgi:hypothetical protein